MDSIDRVDKMQEKEALPPIFKKLNALKSAKLLDEEMCDNIKVMTAGYFFYREGIEIMAEQKLKELT